jgi:class 3 adenylate cyclase
MPASDPGSEGSGIRGERRIVTVLFCDVANSTALAEELDPEEWVEQIDEAFQYLTAAIYHFEGTVVRLLGDAVLAFFGAPLAHEDDPERAILAGLAMIDDLEPFQSRFRREYGLDFNIRIGINTGEVIFGALAAGGEEYTALGDAVNVAARMQQLARPGARGRSSAAWLAVERAEAPTWPRWAHR